MTEKEQARHAAEAQGLRTEIIDAEKARADFQKWKLVLVAALGAAALGVGASDPKPMPLLLCGIPLVCGYVDLLCKHITLRILVIGTYLRKLNEANDPPDQYLDYEGFVQRARKKFNPYGLEDWVMHGSTFVLSALVASYARFAKQAPPYPDGWWPGWPYLLSGFVGLFMLGLVHFGDQSKEKKLEGLEVTR
jgi:hypothetical protein